MRPLFLMLFLSVLIIATGSYAVAQAGSLGDPVYTFDFGSGPNPGPPLGTNFQGTNYTNMQYTTGCPNDGQYTIISSLNNSNNCHTNTWQSLATDHTGNPNGYMMLINADPSPSIFFTAPVDVSYLCPNTTYRFTVYVVNLIKQSAGAGLIEPDIQLSVTTTDGTALAPSTSFIIPTNNPAASPWQPIGITFTTPVNLTSVIVTLSNLAPGGGGNDLVLDDISVRAYGPTISTPTFGLSSGNAILCEGDRATYHFSTFIQPDVYLHPSVQWQENVNSVGWQDLPGDNQQTLDINNEFEPAKPGIYQYRLGVGEGSNINSPLCRVYSPVATITVNAANPPVGGVPSEVPECEGDVLTLTASGGSTYIWTGPDIQPTNANPLIIPNLTPANSGNYKVTAYTAQNCPSPAFSTKVTVYPKAHIAATGGGTYCEGVPVQLSVAGAESYVWTPGASLSDSTSATPIATPSENTEYNVVGTNINGCIDSATVIVNIQKKPVVSAGPDKTIFAGQSVRLNATAQYSNTFSWTPATGLSNPNVLDPIATPASDITYTLQASSSNNCGIATSSIFVRVYQYINIPNTFSPNNDGHNDTWDIDALVTYPESEMLVFNRYGQQVFKSTGYSKPWDGTYDGKPVPAGTYYYVLDLKNNKPKISGYVMVIR